MNSISIYHFVNDDWRNIGGYTVGSDDIPIVERNRNYGIVASDPSIIVSQTYPYSINVNDSFRFVDSEFNIIFAGKAVNVDKDYKTGRRRVNIQNQIAKLKEYRLDAQTLHFILTDTGGDLFKYNPDEAPCVNLLWTLQCCFTRCAFTLDVSEVDSLIFDPTFWDYPVKYKHLAMDACMFYAINQPIAAHYTIYDDPGLGYWKNKITLFDYVQKICEIFGFTIRIIGSSSYKLCKDEAVYVVEDNDKFDYKRQEIKKEAAHIYVNVAVAEGVVEGDYRLKYRQAVTNNYLVILCFGYTDDTYRRGLYYSPEPYSQSIDWPNNLVIVPYVGSIVEEELELDAQIFIVGWRHAYINFSYSPLLYKTHIEQYAKDYIKETITTKWRSDFKNAISNKIDIEKRHSIIEQVTYL